MITLITPWSFIIDFMANVESRGSNFRVFSPLRVPKGPKSAEKEAIRVKSANGRLSQGVGPVVPSDIELRPLLQCST